MIVPLPAKYEAARRALAEAVAIDEVRDIRDKAKAMQVYAAQARDTALMDHATDIRMRAERRGGELLREMAARKERASSKDTLARGRTTRPREAPKLADLKVTKSQSSRWQKLADLDEAAFESKVSDTKRIAVASVEGNREIIHAARAERAEEMRKRREHHEQALADRIQALPDKRYGVIVADPEWRFEPWSRESGLDRAADNHYSTSSTEVIAARDVASIAADDCVLFLWATGPMMPQALAVMAAWGFEYKSQQAWGKDKVGTGYWFRNKHELLLVGTRGNVPAPASGTQWASLVMAPVGEHSAKPECFLEMIERYFPNLPKIELNRRGRTRPGWDAWGAEAIADTPAKSSADTRPLMASDSVDDGIPDFLRRTAEVLP